MAYEPVKSVVKVLELLQALNRRPFSSVDNLHHDTSIPKPTLVRLLSTLVKQGFVAKGPRKGTYVLTALVRSLSGGYHSEPQIIEAAAPICIPLTQEIKWPLGIAVFDHDAMVIQYSTIPYSPMAPYHSVLNLRYTMLGSAMGRAYVSYCSPEDLELILDILHSSENEADARMSYDTAAVSRIVETTRKQGYATRDPAERPDSYSIAVPIFDEDRVVASMAITWFRSALTLSDAVDRYGEPLKNAAFQISKRYENLKLSRHQL